MAEEDHWLPSFNFNVEEWDAEALNYETRTLALARAAFKVPIASGGFFVPHAA